MFSRVDDTYLIQIKSQRKKKKEIENYTDVKQGLDYEYLSNLSNYHEKFFYYSHC